MLAVLGQAEEGNNNKQQIFAKRQDVDVNRAIAKKGENLRLEDLVNIDSPKFKSNRCRVSVIEYTKSGDIVILKSSLICYKSGTKWKLIRKVDNDIKVIRMMKIYYYSPW